MGILLIAQQVLAYLPGGVRSPHFIYLTIFLTMGSVYLDQWEILYTISSQRVEFNMVMVTPYELEILEDLCVENSNPIRNVLFNKKDVCTPSVMKFFMSRSKIGG